MKIVFSREDIFPEHWSQSQRQEMLQHLTKLLVQKVWLAYGQPSVAGGPPLLGYKPVVTELIVEIPNMMGR